MAKQNKDGDWVDGSGRKLDITSPFAGVAPGTNGAVAFRWGDTDHELFVACADAVTSRGALISFSVGREKRSGTITILDGDARPKLFCPDIPAAEEHMRNLIKLALAKPPAP